MMLDSDEFFTELEFEDCPVSANERRSLLNGTPWAAFATIARVAASSHDAGVAASKLEEISGFQLLRATLEDRFIKRSQLLRCFRTVNDARALINQIRFKHLPQYRRAASDEQARQQRFLGVIEAAERNGADRQSARELREFLRSQLRSSELAKATDQLWRDMDRDLSAVIHELEEYSDDFEALRVLESCPAAFSTEELNELRPLLGLYGFELRQRLAPSATPELVRERQLRWRSIAAQTPDDDVRYVVAERAYTRYGLILEELLHGSSPAP
jgi:hypothetical protein